MCCSRRKCFLQSLSKHPVELTPYRRRPPWLADGLHDPGDPTAWDPSTQWVSWYMAEFNEEISMYPDGDGGPFAGANVRNLLAKRFIDGNINAINCSTTFSDPTQFVLNRLREIAFRTAVAAAGIADPVILFGTPDLAQQGLPLAQNWTQTILVNGERTVVAYGLSIPYLICAIVCSLLAVVAIMPLYWNPTSEQLIPLSFNPLEVALMFNATLLQDARGRNVEQYVRKEQGLRRVRCGVAGSDKSDTFDDARIIVDER